VSSELESFRFLIEKCCKRGDHDAKIVRELHACGCQLGREIIRRWVLAETEAGRLPARKPSGRGRPPKKKSLQVADQQSVSPPAPTFAIRETPSTATPQTFSAKAFGSAFGIPIDRQDDLDLLAWARKLGSKRVQSLSDLEFFLIETLNKTWRDHPQKWSQKWVVSVKRSAECLREEMLDAAKMQELIAEIGAKTE
jgi:hypothetical protein